MSTTAPTGDDAPREAGDQVVEQPSTPAASRTETEWERKRRIAEIFGDVLPATTSDERGSGAPRRTESAQDAWLKSQVPPHHGGH